MATKDDDEMVEVRSYGSPSYRGRLNATKYNAMKKALLRVLPTKLPGITQKEMFEAVRPVVPKEMFPGSTHMWWAKGVQLDLEARGIVKRDKDAKPLRWYRPR